MASNIPVIVQGNSFSLAIPLQIYIISEGEMVLQDYTPDPTDEVSVQLKGSRRNYTYTPTIGGNVANIDLTGNELADNYGVVVSIVKADGQRLRSFRTDQFFIVESSDDLTVDDIIEGLEENVIYLNAQPFIAGADGRGIESIVKTGTSGLVDTYTITYTDATTSTFTVTNGAQGAQGEDGVGITSIDKTSTSGLVDTYTITMSNSTTTTFDVTNGRDGVDLGLATIVDNLTEGGSTNVLSAEQGKVLNERLVPVENVLDINSSSAEVSERIGYGQHYGYIIANGINVGGDQYFRYSDPIHLKAGESLKIKANTPTTIGRLASYNPTTQSYVRLEKGTSASTSASEVYENTYTAENDIYIVVGWQCQNYGIELTKTYTKTTTTSKIDVVDAMSDTLEMTTSTETTTSPVVLTTKVGAYAGVTDNKVTTFRSNYSSYKASEDFYLEQGDTIEITANNVPNTVEVLVALDGTLYRAVVRGNGGNLTTTYTAPIDGYFAVSWNPTYGITVIKTSTKATSESERISTIEESTTQIPTLVSSVGDLEDAVFETINDDLTEDIVSGEFISSRGSINTNSDFFYKEFELKAGVEITFTAKGHTNCAPISKRIASGGYEVLATPQSGNHTWTYTTTERCIIALSGYGGNNSRSATFAKQNINTNALDIDVLYGTTDLLGERLKTPDYGLLFDKVAVIGDSLTVGTLDAVSGDDAHAAGGSFGCSWLTCLAKRWGSTIRMHYGVGGSTCYSWLGSNQYGLGLMLKDSVIYDAYFIAYGHNDAGNYTIGTTSDTPTDVTVDENNDVVAIEPAADTTFLGNYKKIVNEIRTKAPNALIFMLCTDAKDSSTAGTIGYMNQYIEELAEWYYAQGDRRVFYVDYINTYVRKSGDFISGHWSTFGYVNIALAINDALNEVIEQYMNTNALKAWGNYLESYRTTKNDQTRSGGYLPHL